ncbi:MAG: ribonuclease P protein component [Halanaerobiales bacterium]|nr:ribonuclease P protein component [Halanaerobiales bacterium]
METLKKKSDFNRVYKRGKSKASSHLVLYWYPNGENINRYGFSINKRIGKAVVRNKLKRRLKEIIRKEIDRSFKKGYDFILIARKPIVSLEYKEIQKDLIKLFRRSSLLV